MRTSPAPNSAGFGLTNTTLLFSSALIVLISGVGTLLTDNRTDGHHVPLGISTTPSR